MAPWLSMARLVNTMISTKVSKKLLGLRVLDRESKMALGFDWPSSLISIFFPSMLRRNCHFEMAFEVHNTPHGCARRMILFTNDFA